MAEKIMENSRKPKRRKVTMAESADRHELYEAAVQNVAENCSFIEYTFNGIRGRKPISFREDFCGTASASCEWVRLGRKNFAFGVDIDPEVLKWGRKNRVSQLTKAQQQRVALIHGDVMEVETPPVDVISACNFSYWLFLTRLELLRYFETVYRNLADDGVLFLDAYGGWGAFMELKEKMKLDGFKYIWEQADYCPITGKMNTHIHFKFSDGSKLKKAFSYQWRVWTLPEIRELLEEAGFVNPTVYFEYRNDKGEGLGEWYPATEAEATAAWIANITAEKPS